MTNYNIMLLFLYIIFGWLRPVSYAVKEETWALELVPGWMNNKESLAEELGVTVAWVVYDNVIVVKGHIENPLLHPGIMWAQKQKPRPRIPRDEVLPSMKQKVQIKINKTNSKQTIKINKIPTNESSDIIGVKRNTTNLRNRVDPLIEKQWYLGSGPGVHLNVTGAWKLGVTGKGVSVAILDDGIDVSHPDLSRNYDKIASWDMIDDDNDPSPGPWAKHGTNLAGIVAAEHNNGHCGAGIAYHASLGGMRMLDYLVLDAEEGRALAHARQHVSVYVAAWGPMDDGASLESPGILASRALREGVTLGRGGRGSIFVWASGNGGLVGDDCNADGYANSIWTLTVSAATRKGLPPSYSETCAAILTTTYSGDDDITNFPIEKGLPKRIGIVTTDTGGVCSSTFRGTSPSAALAAGAVALALEVNPNLGWRDMQYLVIAASKSDGLYAPDWQTNGVGLQYSHYFGFGALDAGRLVQLAKTWDPVLPSHRWEFTSPQIHKMVPPPGETLGLPLEVSACGLLQMEHVEVMVLVEAPLRGEVIVELQSPQGTRSVLLPPRPRDRTREGFGHHKFTTVHMWGEDPLGTWTLLISQRNTSKHHRPAKYLTWTIILHGTQKPIPETRKIIRGMETDKHFDIQMLHNNISKANVSDVRPRVDVLNWQSTQNSDNHTYSYVFCRVHAPSPDHVADIAWHDAKGGIITDIIREIRARGPRASSVPSLLLVRRTKYIPGHFVCLVTYQGRVYQRNLEVKEVTPQNRNSTLQANLGSILKIKCEVPYPLVTASWMKDNILLEQSERIEIQSGILTIIGAKESDSGLYRCSVKAPKLHYLRTTFISLKVLPNLDSAINVESSSFTKINQKKHVSPSAKSTLCPRLFTALDKDYCIMIISRPTSWHKSRSQCRRYNGDLLMLKDSDMLLTIIKYLHNLDYGNKSFWVGGSTVSGGDGWAWVDGSHFLPSAPLWHVNSNGLPIRVQQLGYIQRRSRKQQRNSRPISSALVHWRSRQNRATKRNRNKFETNQQGEWRQISSENKQSLGRALPGAGACMLPKFGHVLAACHFANRLSYICLHAL